MKRKSLFTFLTMLLAGICFAQVQTAKPNVSMTGGTGGYLEYLPQGYNPNGTERYPVILFLHGSGETGSGNATDLQKMDDAGLPKLLVTPGDFPTSFTVNGITKKFIIISPQFTYGATASRCEAIFNYIQSHYKTDSSRLYLTGLSLGGGGTWEYPAASSAYAMRIAAAVPICGNTSGSTTKGAIIGNADLPIWAFHNAGDPTVAVGKTTGWINFINAVSPTPLAKATIWPGGGHDAWTQAYNPLTTENGLNMYQWMLQYTRGTPPPNVLPVANAGPDQTTSLKLPTTSVTLSGSGTDADGTISSYAWTKISGPASSSFSSTSTAVTTVSNLAQGNYVFQLTVTDNNGGSASDQMTVIVGPPLCPTSTTSNAEIIVRDSLLYKATLTASGSVPPGLSGPLKYKWRFAGFKFPGSPHPDSLQARLAPPNQNTLVWIPLDSLITYSESIKQTAVTRSAIKPVNNPYLFEVKMYTDESSCFVLDTLVVIDSLIAPVGPPPGTRVINVNVTGTELSGLGDWNDFLIGTGVQGSKTSQLLKYSDSMQSHVYSRLSASTGIYDNSNTAAATMCPPNVYRFTSGYTGTRTLIIDSLYGGNTKYNLEFYCSRYLNDEYYTYITIGDSTKNVESFRNYSNKLVFSNVQAVNGRITVNIAPDGVSGHYNYINGFKIIEITSAGTGKSVGAIAGGAHQDARTVSPETVPVGDFSVSAMPNPARNSANIVVQASRFGPATLEIHAVSGKLVQANSKINLSKGRNVIPVALNRLEQGQYIVTVVFGGQKKSSFLTVLK